MGVAVTVALTFAPQVIESGQRIRRARRLRGGTSRKRQVIRTIVVPVLTDALDRSLSLAAAMDSRGYGRSADVPRRTRLTSSALLLGGLVGACVGTYGLLDSTVPRALGLPMLALGVAAAIGGLGLAGRRVRRTAYRPDPWTLDEWAVAACGMAVAAVLVTISQVDPADLHPSLVPLAWPSLSLAPVLGVLIGVLPAWLAPPVERRAAAVGRPVESARAAG
jgi:energy-coupling factor transport system permease protein